MSGASWTKLKSYSIPRSTPLTRRHRKWTCGCTAGSKIRTDDGRHFDSGIVERGADHYTDEDLQRKFRWLIGYVFPEAKDEILLDGCHRVRGTADVGELMNYL